MSRCLPKRDQGLQAYSWHHVQPLQRNEGISPLFSDFDENLESEDSLNDGSEIEDEPTDDVCDDQISIEDAVVLGGTMMGLAYEEGLEERKRKKLEKKMADEKKHRNSNSKT